MHSKNYLKSVDVNNGDLCMKRIVILMSLTSVLILGLIAVVTNVAYAGKKTHANHDDSLSSQYKVNSKLSSFIDKEGFNFDLYNNKAVDYYQTSERQVQNGYHACGSGGSAYELTTYEFSSDNKKNMRDGFDSISLNSNTGQVRFIVKIKFHSTPISASEVYKQFESKYGKGSCNTRIKHKNKYLNFKLEVFYNQVIIYLEDNTDCVNYDKQAREESKKLF